MPFSGFSSSGAATVKNNRNLQKNVTTGRFINHSENRKHRYVVRKNASPQSTPDSILRINKHHKKATVLLRILIGVMLIAIAGILLIHFIGYSFTKGVELSVFSAVNRFFVR